MNRSNRDRQSTSSFLWYSRTRSEIPERHPPAMLLVQESLLTFAHRPGRNGFSTSAAAHEGGARGTKTVARSVVGAIEALSAIPRWYGAISPRFVAIPL
jgi:hypothetical protein